MLVSGCRLVLAGGGFAGCWSQGASLGLLAGDRRSLPAYYSSSSRLRDRLWLELQSLSLPLYERTPLFVLRLFPWLAARAVPESRLLLMFGAWVSSVGWVGSVGG